ncbi:MAG: 3'(2'),5'-bisphosphate nucleotidase CysQ [Gammaproteobacteria bacterium]|nr:3'(2'),5'-bisphosphate nucleotidase CysQ [Gammaproteobacteria bacterium]
MRMDRERLKELEQPVIALARLAGERILEVYETAFEVSEKKDHSPVTEADFVAHDVINEGLRNLTPKIPILSEEGKFIDFKERRQWTRFWLIDPLDGTREFVKRNDEFAVNIALVEEHVPVLGIVYAPVRDTVYFASHRNGAYKQKKNAEAKSIKVSETADQPIRVAGSRSHSNKKLELYLEQLGAHSMLTLGSALKACLVAEGKADLYPRFGPTSEWDTAAPQCILEEAGGALTDIEMQPLQYNTRESLTNPSFFAFGDKNKNWAHYL